ncbi:endo-1,4-beta-xylanase [Algoriphagus sp.]|uniref:endo-1,4-beta-xylanase n=1 Tax=Algoriphagus sp. TaxID=1872435 RepID=UPI00272958BF|nr:endo-1,4-beta-xylanase [Algoriphagus sp.]MDP3200084.1 endo-1,4-beta-xylanase [Algoriphagus sp.]
MKNRFQEDFFIGAAVNLAQVTGREVGADSLLELHFSSITSENGLKWGPVHPKEGEYNFEFGDAYVAMGEKMGAFTIGHTLVWHQQTPAWVFQNGEGQFLNQMDLIRRMEDHIATVVGRYKGKIDGWDVVNEAFEDDGSWRKTHWYNITGTEFIKAAFRKANEIDPDVELYYNDYNVWKPEKRKAILALAKELRAEGIRIDGIGMQGHYRLNSPSLDQIEQAIVEIHDAGFQVMFTELDVDVLPRPSDSEGADLNINYAESPEWNPYADSLPQAVAQELVARYVSLFQLFRKHSDKISRVTFWGLHDGRSWLNNWPVRGRTNYALIFDRQMKLKAGFLEGIEKP